MSKPTYKQLLVLDALRSQADYWSTSNDIHSPSHATDIDEELSLLELDNEISEDEQREIGGAIKGVWSAIASLDPREHNSINQ